MGTLRKLIREEIEKILNEESNEKKVYRNKDGVMFWAEKVPDDFGGIESWAVIQQAEGYPATEAFDDWFTNFDDANEMAKMLANGEDPYQE